MIANENVKGILSLRSMLEHVYFKNFISTYDQTYNLNHTHIITMIVLLFEGSSPMSMISERVNLEKGSFTPVANRLINLGFVQKERDQTDKRIYNLSLTEQGKNFAKEFKEAHWQYISNLLEVFNDKEKESYFNALETLLEMTKKLEEIKE